MVRVLSLCLLFACLCSTFAACSKQSSQSAGGTDKQASETDKNSLASEASESSRRSTPAKQASMRSEPGILPGTLTSQTAGSVAIIDLNRVAVRLERISGFQASLEARRRELEGNIQLLDDGYKTEIDEIVERYGNSPDEKQQAEIDRKRQQRLLSVNQAKLQAQQQLNAYEEKIRAEFMDEVRPIAYEVAHDYGFSVVLTVPQVYAFRVGSEQDITDRVVERVRLKSPSQPAKDLPRLASPVKDSKIR